MIENRKHNNDAWLAWHVAALSRISKRFPRLDTLLIKPKSKRQTWQQQLAIAKMWAAQSGGRISSKVN